MTRRLVLPFLLRRSQDVFGADGITTTAETIHGLLHLDATRLTIQWRLARETDRFGPEIRTDREVEPVRDVRLPLGAIGGVALRRSWWPWRRFLRVVLTAADLQAFEEVAGTGGLQLAHPAELVLLVRRIDKPAAAAFIAELDLVLAERALEAAEQDVERLPGT